MDPLKRCPYCGTCDVSLPQGPQLFLCVFCQSLYSVFKGVQSGVDGYFVAVYEPFAPFFIGTDNPEHPDFTPV